MRLRRRPSGEPDATAAEAGATEAGATEVAPAPRRRFRLPSPPRSRRGLFILVVLVGGIGAATAFGGITVLHYTETAGFCGRCHTMGPELKAYAMSPHSDLPCAECHVSPGIRGLIRAKINGTK